MAKLINNTERYTAIGQHLFYNKELSLEELGLLCLMLSLPDGWEYSVAGLAALKTNSLYMINKTIKSLEAKKYVRRVQRKTENGKFAGYDYVISDKPLSDEDIEPFVEIPQTELPFTATPYTATPFTATCIQSNTNKYITKKSNTKKDNISPKTSLKEKQEAEERFNRFWECYPRKIKRKNAEKAWEKISPNEELTEKIIEAVNNAKKHDYRFKEEKYTPHPATWLNGMEWENQFENNVINPDNYIDYENYVPTEDYRLI